MKLINAMVAQLVRAADFKPASSLVRVQFVALFLLITISTSVAQTLYSNQELVTKTKHKFPYVYWKDPGKDLAGGFLVGNLHSYGVALNWWHIYFQVKINQNYSPDALNWDIAHTHQAGLIINLTPKIEFMAGYGYVAFLRKFDDNGILLINPEDKLKWTYNNSITYNYQRLKFLTGFTASPFEWHIGILYNSIK